MNNSMAALHDFRPQHDFFIGIDSDGCVFDSMEIKQKECFCPQFINHMELQPVARYARETWEFVNLYSKTRGCNRFLALVTALNLLEERSEVRARQVSIPRMEGVRAWIGRETKLGNPALKNEVDRVSDPDLRRALEWSETVNDVIAAIVRRVPPFPGVQECLKNIRNRADAIVVSQTPGEALEREWREHGIDTLVRMIAGQELGTKTEHLRFATCGRYAPDHVLMIGDAPGDLQAARKNKALFFPIIPGEEELSWNRLYGEGLDRFFNQAFQGSYENELIARFEASLPENAPWLPGSAGHTLN